MTIVTNASVVFKDKNGNVGTVKGASANDITKISNAISDVAQVVNPTNHLPIQATTSSVGVVQLADSAAIAAGTSGRIVDAAQLKDAIEHVTPAGNLMTTDTAQTVTAVKTFSSLPESSVAPTTDNQLVNKKYVDDHATPLPSNLVTTDTAQTISAVKTFTALPQSSVAPSASFDLVNKAYVDGQVDNVMADLALKADKDLTNLNNVGKEAIAHNSVPSYISDELTIGADGTSYTPPTDGYVSLMMRSTVVGQYCMINNGCFLFPTFSAPQAGTDMRLFVPVQKGVNFHIFYNCPTTPSTLLFVYLNGTKHEKA